MLTVSVVELISWFITIVSVILFLVERRKNARLPYYMAIQGILRACKEKSGFYASYLSEVRNRNEVKSIPKEEYMLFISSVYSDYVSLMEHIMGSLKAIEPGKDMPFDTHEFTKPRRDATLQASPTGQSKA